MRQTRKRRASREEGGAKPPAPRASLYEDGTRRIIAELEACRFPWVQPWGHPEGKGGGAGPVIPRNGLTGRSYSGVNVLILWASVIARGWPSTSWLTSRQALAAGCAVRQGDRGNTVVYAARFTP